MHVAILKRGDEFEASKEVYMRGVWREGGKEGGNNVIIVQSQKEKKKIALRTLLNNSLAKTL